MKTQRDFEFTDADFDNLRKLVATHTGISLSEQKRSLVYSRLSRRLRSLGHQNFRQYLNFLEQNNDTELEEFTNAITTNLTSFFRESHHFDYLRQTVVPKLLDRRRDSRRIRVWSAGCSTGEEPYSIAMVLRESVPQFDQWDIKILATDLDTSCVEQASAGIYPAERIKDLSTQRTRRWFQKGSGENADKVIVIPELKDIISYRKLNLMDDWPMHGPFDFIFCRNVVIYFDKPTQRILFERFANISEEQAHLFIGHSESLFKVTDRFQLIGKTIYRKLR
jgi:chemotaxis protein methyltransferase CheR